MDYYKELRSTMKLVMQYIVNDNNEIEINNVKKIDDGFLSNNNELRYINLPLVKELGHDFLKTNMNLSNIDIPLAESILLDYNIFIKNGWLFGIS